MTESNTFAVAPLVAARQLRLEDTALDHRDRARLLETLTQETRRHPFQGGAAGGARHLTPAGKALLYLGRIPTTLAAVGAFVWLLVEVVLSLFGAPGLMDNWAVLGIFLGVYVLWAICLFTPIPTAVDEKARATAAVVGLPDRAVWS